MGKNNGDEVKTGSDGIVMCQNSQGLELRATLLKLTRFQAVFEVYSPACVLRTSEVLSNFKITINDRTAYSGRAVVSNLINTGAIAVCEATLEDAWFDLDLFPGGSGPQKMQEGFRRFLQASQHSFKVLPEFKVLLADMASYLSDLRLWLDQVELGIRSTPTGDRLQLERQTLQELRGPIIPSLNALFEKFELVASLVPAEDKPAHRTSVRRQIHPLVLCAPFAYRTYHKPLGYAGDYEMVNMILRDPFEGGSVFAKMLNAWFISQPPAEAHRNRIDYLAKQLVQETLRIKPHGRLARVFNLGCGPAGEIQRFLTENALCEAADLTLLDFNDETLAYTSRVLQDLKARHGRSTPIKMVKKSVGQILKGKGKSTVGSLETKYDLLYCAGLFDYLSDENCRQLMNIFYDMLAPGGLLIATNVDAFNPIQQMLDYVLDWNLVYRTGQQLKSLAPAEADPDLISTYADVTSVNIYLEVRKPCATS